MFSIVELVIIGFIVFLTIFAVVDRICKCVENKSNAKAFSSIANPNIMDSLLDYVERNDK